MMQSHKTFDYEQDLQNKKVIQENITKIVEEAKQRGKSEAKNLIFFKNGLKKAESEQKDLLL